MSTGRRIVLHQCAVLDSRCQWMHTLGIGRPTGVEWNDRIETYPAHGRSARFKQLAQFVLQKSVHQIFITIEVPLMLLLVEFYCGRNTGSDLSHNPLPILDMKYD